jgi:hypothetical protein
MNMRTLNCIVPFACLCLALQAQSPNPPSKLLRKDPIMTRRAAGTFDVKTSPLAGDDATASTLIGRYALVKHFHGDLEATSKGEMLATGDPSTGNAGYVAIEQITGTLHGHAGSFAFQHIGVMDHGNLKLSVTVVPGSGSGELTGISGTMTILNDSGKHSYEFEYIVPQSTSN